MKIPEGYVFGSKKPEELRGWLLGLLKSPKTRPDAIFCSGDNLATIAVSAINESGLGVPDDVSVAGFGDLSCGRFFAPRISTVDECHEKCSGRIVEKIMAELSGGKHGELYEAVRPSLVMRDSTSAKKT